MNEPDAIGHGGRAAMGASGWGRLAFVAIIIGLIICCNADGCISNNILRIDAMSSGIPQ